MRSFLVASVLTLISLAGVYSIDDRIPDFGYDGKGHAARAIHFSDPDYRPNRFGVQRILPSIFVHYGLRATGSELSPDRIEKGFSILNWLAVAIVLVAWHVIAEELQFSSGARLLGLMALTWNFAVVKFNGYYPVLTDTSAFALGAVMLAGYLKRNRVVMVLCTIASAFTWQTGPLFGAILLAFPRNEPSSAVARRYTARARSAAWGAAAIIAILIVIDILLESGPKRFPQFYWSAYEITGIYTLSVLLSGAYVLFSLGFLFLSRLPVNLRDEIRRIDYRSLAVLVLGLTLAFYAQYLWADPNPDPNGGLTPTTSIGGIGQLIALVGRLSGEFLMLSVQLPAAFIIGHVVWFGPIIICTILLWPVVTRIAADLGPGIWAGALFTVLFALNSESRHLIMLLPLMVCVTTKAAEITKVTQRADFLVFFGLTSLWLAKPWLFIGPIGDDPDVMPNFLYYMNFAFYMRPLLWWTYVGIIVLIAWTIVAAYLPKSRRASEIREVSIRRTAEYPRSR